MRRRHLLLLLVLLALPAAAFAQAQGDANLTLSPNKAGKHSRLIFTAAGSALSSGQQPPKSVSLFIARGFRLDPRARRGRCTDQQANQFDCPANSKVASGTADGEVTIPPFPAFSFSATVEAFLAPRAQRGDIAGVVIEGRESKSGRQAVIHGRLLRVSGDPRFGAELRFDNFDLGQQQAPAGASAKLTHFDLNVEARRKVKKVRVVRHHRRKRVRRYYLITNPKRCAGSWPYELRVTFASGPEQIRDGSVTCQS